jgi:hypothetical protein
VTEPGADAELLATALEKLRALRLVADAPVGPDEPAAVVARPAIARFALDAPTIRDRRDDQVPGAASRRASASTKRGVRR